MKTDIGDLVAKALDEMGITTVKDIKITVGYRGAHVDFLTPIDDVWQYVFIKFE